PHLRLKIESAAATTTERGLYRGRSAAARTTASRALTWFATKTAGPVRSRSSSRSRTLSRQKLDRAGNSRLDCSAARIRRIPFVRAHKAVSTASPFMVGMSVGAPVGVRRLIRADARGLIAERMRRHSRPSPEHGDRDPHGPGDVQYPAGYADGEGGAVGFRVDDPLRLRVARHPWRTWDIGRDPDSGRCRPWPVIRADSHPVRGESIDWAKLGLKPAIL